MQSRTSEKPYNTHPERSRRVCVLVRQLLPQDAVQLVGVGKVHRVDLNVVKGGQPSRLVPCVQLFDDLPHRRGLASARHACTTATHATEQPAQLINGTITPCTNGSRPTSHSLNAHDTRTRVHAPDQTHVTVSTTARQ